MLPSPFSAGWRYDHRTSRQSWHCEAKSFLALPGKIFWQPTNGYWNSYPPPLPSLHKPHRRGMWKKYFQIYSWIYTSRKIFANHRSTNKEVPVQYTTTFALDQACAVSHSEYSWRYQANFYVGIGRFSESDGNQKKAGDALFFHKTFFLWHHERIEFLTTRTPEEARSALFNTFVNNSHFVIGFFSYLSGVLFGQYLCSTSSRKPRSMKSSEAHLFNASGAGSENGISSISHRV